MSNRSEYRSVGMEKRNFQSGNFVGVIGVSIPKVIPNRWCSDSLKSHLSIDSIDLK
jgi:hypothetical protein